MKSYLRKMVDDTVMGMTCPTKDLEKIRAGVPDHVVTKTWDDVIFSLFLEKGDTAYARDGYHDVVNLIEKHLLKK